jgi:hypothetical protein
MVVGRLVDDGAKEERVLEQTLDGLDEQRGEVPRVGEGRGKGAGVREVCRQRGRLRKGVEVREGVGVPGDVELVGGFQSRDL